MKMEEAPRIGDQVPVQTQSKAKIPTLSLIACGGCGINLVTKMLAKESQADLIDRIAISAVDTSEANMTNLPDGIAPFMVADRGSGKVRDTHIEQIQYKLDNANIEYGDINVIVFSMSGGTGSVIGPLLARSCAMRGEAVVLVGVVDDQSRQDCMNSIGTFKTMQSYCEDEGLYFPIMLYSNINTGRFAVNKTVGVRLNTLIEMFISRNVEEIDFQDKINFLTPHKIRNADVGVYTLNVTKSLGKVKDGSDDTLPGEFSITISNAEPAHASITIDDEGMSLHKFSNVSFVGYSETETYYAVVGRPIDSGLLTQLKKTADRHASSKGVAVSNLSGELDEAGKKKTLLAD